MRGGGRESDGQKRQDFIATPPPSLSPRALPLPPPPQRRSPCTQQSAVASTQSPRSRQRRPQRHRGSKRRRSPCIAAASPPPPGAPAASEASGGEDSARLVLAVLSAAAVSRSPAALLLKVGLEIAQLPLPQQQHQGQARARAPPQPRQPQPLQQHHCVRAHAALFHAKYAQYTRVLQRQVRTVQALSRQARRAHGRLRRHGELTRLTLRLRAEAEAEHAAADYRHKIREESERAHRAYVLALREFEAHRRPLAAACAVVADARGLTEELRRRQRLWRQHLVQAGAAQRHAGRPRAAPR